MGTLCISGVVINKAGAGVSATLNEEYEEWILQAEALISAVSRYDWVANYPAGAVDRKVLEQVASDLAAIYAIQYDMTGYVPTIIGEDMVTILRDRALHVLQLLKDQKGVTFTK